jgi:hypothetical protein
MFIIPGSSIGVRLAVSIQALVVEGRRGTQAMGRCWELVGGHWWHAFGTLVVAGLLTGVINAVITAPFSNTSWFVQAVAAAVATTVTLPYGVLVGVLLDLDLRAREETLNLDRLRADLQASPDAPGRTGAGRSRRVTQPRRHAAKGVQEPDHGSISEIWIPSPIPLALRGRLWAWQSGPSAGLVIGRSVVVVYDEERSPGKRS